MQEYYKIYEKGYGDKCISYKVKISESYWSIFCKLFLGVKNDYINSIKTELAACKEKCIHVVDVPIFAYFVLKVLVEKLNKKVIFTMHDPVPHSQSSFMKKMVRLVNFTLNKKIIKLSEKNNNLVIHVHSKQLLNNIDCNGNFIFSPHPSSIINKDVSDVFNLSDNYDFVFSFVGTINYYKGINTFVDAILLFNKTKTGKKILFVIAGKWSEFDERILAEDNVMTVNKFLSDSEFDSVIKYSNCIVLPYRDATQSGVLSRAIAFDKPIIINNVGVLKEYVSNETGVVINDLNPEKLANVFNDFIDIDFKYDKRFNDKFNPQYICDKLLNSL